MKYLLLENDFHQKDDPIAHLWNKLNKPNNELKIINNASNHDRKLLLEALLWCDELWFQTTFLRHDELYGIALILGKIPAKTIKIYNLSSRSVESNVESLLKLEEAARLDKHTVYDISQYKQEILVDLSGFQKEIDRIEKERKEYNDSLINIGEDVIIGKIDAVGLSWSTLKEGDVVPVLETPDNDPAPGRGVWVRGLYAEPVKLLNEDRRLEFQFKELKAINLAREFFSFKGQTVNPELLELLMWRINNLQKEINNGHITLWEFCNELCDYIGVERRFHRAYFEKRLQEYLNKYTYFAELNRN